MPGFADVNVKLYQDICRFFSTFNAIYNLYSGTKTYSLLEHTEVFQGGYISTFFFAKSTPNLTDCEGVSSAQPPLGQPVEKCWKM